MKNRLYNRIIVSGLLSSSFVLFGMEPNSQPLTTASTSSTQLTTSNPTTPQASPKVKKHHTSLLNKMEHLLDPSSASTTAPTSTTSPSSSQKHRSSRSPSPSPS